MFRTEGLCSMVWEKPGKGYPPVDTPPLNSPLGCRTLIVVTHLIRNKGTNFSFFATNIQIVQGRNNTNRLIHYHLTQQQVTVGARDFELTSRCRLR